MLVFKMMLPSQDYDAGVDKLVNHSYAEQDYSSLYFAGQ